MSYLTDDQYRIIGKIGEGGMGTVYLAEDTTLERRVAIKELNRPLVAEEQMESRFQQEALALARLNHPNITHLYSFLPKGDTFWMVMEYVEGKTLDEWMKNHGRLSPVVAVSITIQILEGLQHAHRRGIIHRDLKPSNVMISDDGEVKIMDFGIARIRDSRRITRHGKSVGTLEYMAPEQVQGQEGDERTDIYAVGNILYEMLCGHTPFTGETDYEVMKAKLEEKPAMDFPLGVSAVLQRVIFQALSRNASRRHGSASLLQQALSGTMPGMLLKHEALTNALSTREVIEDQLVPGTRSFKPFMVFDTVKKISRSLPVIEWKQAGSAIWILAGAVVLCVAMIVWGSSLGEPPQKNIKQNEIVVSEGEDEDVASSAATIESQLSTSLPVANNAYSDNSEPRREETIVEEPPRKSKESKKGATKNDESTEDDIAEDLPVGARDVADTYSGPVDLPAGKAIRVILDESLTSENVDMDGTIIRMHCDEDVAVRGRTVIKRGAVVTAKVVDVIPSTMERKKALIGFVIQKVQAADGSLVRLHSDRFRLFSDAPGTPAVFRKGQSFTVKLGRGRIN